MVIREPETEMLWCLGLGSVFLLRKINQLRRPGLPPGTKGIRVLQMTNSNRQMEA